ncbi:hypothetical protein [Bifidobacterium myosotis]|uniref:Uncharacterized protein n=1 Tax=Bifidobacterium myosotis TaxID=1630166 RepID=A0A5M9ZKI8_9BIFI|nr:hypothetical protein [Bifidobacterium myosotis]KAA8828110.1 hypothetical protein EMO91_06630 [Bifidobacterium myosotis]
MDCAPSASYGAKCVVIADYADAHQKVGEVYISSSNDTITWLTSKVAGVKLIHSYQLDLNQIATMYAGDADCISSDDSKPICYAITLTSKPAQPSASSVVVQSPTAGAPVSDLTIPALAVGAGLAALGFGLSRRRRA